MKVEFLHILITAFAPTKFKFLPAAVNGIPVSIQFKKLVVIVVAPEIAPVIVHPDNCKYLPSVSVLP